MEELRGYLPLESEEKSLRFRCDSPNVSNTPKEANPTSKSVKINVLFTCGHSYTYSSPGTSDPAGLYRLLAKDGLVESGYTCFLCEKN